ncbi:MAG: hypothetical protein J6U77_01095, partial [Verrucomicrobia bacterium]|nr:hypothetical protein [Verrucomicrobiota bacterium]
KLVPNGMEAEVLGLSQDWLHVIADEQIGFIKANGVSPRLAYTYGVPGGKPMKARITQYCSVYSKPILPGDDVGDAGDPNGLILSTAGIGECTVYQIKNGYARIDPSRQMWVSLEVLEWIEE